MKKLNNRGVSLIEILIAVVVFVVCITPIINQLATSIRVGQKADDQQAATDYGKSLAESLKQVELGEVINLETGLFDSKALAEMLDLEKDSIAVTESFYTVKADGSKGSIIPAQGAYIHSTSLPVGDKKTIDYDNSGVPYTTVTQMYQKVKAMNASLSDDEKEALVRVYNISGKASLDYREYDVKITLDTLPYALNSLNKTNYVDPNALNLGNLSSLDTKTTAVVTSISNYDSIASASYFNSVLSALEKSTDPADQNLAEQIKNGNRFINCDVNKKIKITIDSILGGDANGNYYTVSCKALYETSDLLAYGVPADEMKLDYTVYEQKFATFPEVYLLYNQFLYMSSYKDDSIVIENNVARGAKVYVIRTAKNDSRVKDITPVGSNTSGKLLPASTYSRDIQDSGYKYMTNFVLENDYASYPVDIYTNIFYDDETDTVIPGNVSSSTEHPGSRDCKMSINVAADKVNDVVHLLDDDERYSETGRAYNVLISLTNTKTNNVTTFDSSKGDY